MQLKADKECKEMANLDSVKAYRKVNPRTKEAPTLLFLMSEVKYKGQKICGNIFRINIAKDNILVRLFCANEGMALPTTDKQDNCRDEYDDENENNALGEINSSDTHNPEETQAMGGSRATNVGSSKLPSKLVYTGARKYDCFLELDDTLFPSDSNPILTSSSSPSSALLTSSSSSLFSSTSTTTSSSSSSSSTTTTTNAATTANVECLMLLL